MNAVFLDTVGILALVNAAWDANERGAAGQAEIIDHVSFVVMRRLGLTEAFTSDAHFRAAGFETLF